MGNVLALFHTVMKKVWDYPSYNDYVEKVFSIRTATFGTLKECMMPTGPQPLQIT